MNGSIIRLFILVKLCFSVETLPPKCSGSTSLYCFPVTPTFLQTYNWDLSVVETFTLYGTWTLATLPLDTFKYMNNIKHLRMNNGGLYDLPNAIFSPLQNTLESVSMDGNLFYEFPTCSLNEVISLKELSFRNQQMEIFMATDVKWSSLTKIDLNNNKISMFNISVNNHNEVKLLLDNNYIVELMINRLNKIWYISARNNHLEYVHEDVFQTSKSSLRYLDFSSNRLDDRIWDTLEDVLSIETLLLRQNEIVTVRASVINHASDLKYLKLSSNRILSVADIQLRSGKMTHVIFKSNNLTHVHSNFISRDNTFVKTTYCTLDLSDNYIERMHLPIPATDSATASNFRLYLQHNRLTSLTFDHIDTQIRILSISNNRFSTLPSQLPKAKWYSLSHNALDTNNVIFKMKHEMNTAVDIDMENIGLYCMQSNIDMPIFNLPNLRHLNMKHNCVPLNILCQLNTTSLNLYLDHNCNGMLSCTMQHKSFRSLSINECCLNEASLENIGKYIENASLISFKSATNNIPSLPRLEFTNTYHVELDFSESKIKVLDDMIFKNAYYVKLNFDRNEVSKLHAVTFNTDDYCDVYLSYQNNSLLFINKTVINISGNYRLRHLKIDLDISLNTIKYVNFEQIIYFNYSRYYLHYVYVGINASYNNLTVYDTCINMGPAFYFKLTLDLSHNQISDLPDNSCAMARSMYFGHNLLSSISRTLPSGVTETLSLEWNSISDIHENAFDNLTNLETLNLEGNMLTSLPTSLTKLKYLRHLDLQDNFITQIHAVNYLTNLETLYLKGNMLTSLPTSVAKLKSLRHLDLETNFITEVHWDLFDALTRLQTLNLKGNMLRSFPSSSKFFPSLIVFRVSFNEVRSVKDILELNLTDNYVLCDCNLLFLRNYTLTAYGRCSAPPEYEGYHVSCFPYGHCIEQRPLYITKQTKDSCQNDEFIDFRVTTTELKNHLIIQCKRLGPRRQEYLKLTAYIDGDKVQNIVLNDSSQTSTFVLKRNPDPDLVCLFAFLQDSGTFKKCANVSTVPNIASEHYLSANRNDQTNVYALGSLFALSLLLNILASIYIFARYKRGNTVQKQNGNNPGVVNLYEITSSNLSHPNAATYDEISIPGGGIGNEAYINLSV